MLRRLCGWLVCLSMMCCVMWQDAALAATVCDNLHKKAGRLYARAVKLQPPKKASRAGQLVPICVQQTAGRQAETLYRAALVYKCPQSYLSTFRLAVLYQSCVVSKRASCRYYGMARRDCQRPGACRKSLISKEQLLAKLLPFVIQDAQTDSDRDGFRSCLKTRIECSALAQIKEIPIPGLGADGRGKAGKERCDCDDSDPKVYPGALEICDGKDNDCDGRIDEIEELKPPACGNQRGACRGSRKRCGGVRGWLLCEAADFARKGVAYETKETLCDGIDNDCDGQIDNGLTAPKCRNQRGVCLGARQVCGGKDGWQPCTVSDFQKHSKLYELSEQACDGMDNDCDGRVDNIREAPSCPLEAGVCAGIKKRCGGKGGWLACTLQDYQRHNASYEAVERRCDGKDNDCDGKIDETCMPIYPWIIAGSGASVVLMGALVRALAVHDPEDVAATPQPSRPHAAEVRTLIAFGNASIVIGGVAVAAGLGIGIAYLVRVLGERKRAAPPPPAKQPSKGQICGPVSKACQPADKGAAAIILWRGSDQ